MYLFSKCSHLYFASWLSIPFTLALFKVKVCVFWSTRPCNFQERVREWERQSANMIKRNLVKTYSYNLIIEQFCLSHLSRFSLGMLVGWKWRQQLPWSYLHLLLSFDWETPSVAHASTLLICTMFVKIIVFFTWVFPCRFTLQRGIL